MHCAVTKTAGCDKLSKMHLPKKLHLQFATRCPVSGEMQCSESWCLHYSAPDRDIVTCVGPP